MDRPTHPAQPNRPGKEREGSNPLKYTFDGHFSPKTPPDDNPTNTIESNHTETETGQRSGSEYSGPVASLAACFRLIADTVLRMELAELEMTKKREAARLESQKRQFELEDELTRMMLQTQSQIASLVSRNSSTSVTRKRSSNSTNDASGKS